MHGVHRRGQLLDGGGLDPFPHHAQFAPFGRIQLEAGTGRVDDYITHSTPSDVDDQRPDAGDVDRRVELIHESRLIDKADTGHLSVAALALHIDKPRRGFESEPGDGLLHGEHPGLQQDRGDAYGVAARHRRVLRGFHDDVAHQGLRIVGRQNDVDVPDHIAARLAQQAETQVVPMVLQVVPLVEHGLTGHVADTTHHYVANLPCRMAPNYVDEIVQLHRNAPSNELFVLCTFSFRLPTTRQCAQQQTQVPRPHLRRQL